MNFSRVYVHAKSAKKFRRLIKRRIVKREDQEPFAMLGLLFISFYCATQFGIWDPPSPKVPRDPRGAQRDETAGGNLPFVIFSRDCTSRATRVHRRQDVVRRSACNYAIWIAMSLAATAALCGAKREVFRIGGRITPCILGNGSGGSGGGNNGGGDGRRRRFLASRCTSECTTLCRAAPPRFLAVDGKISRFLYVTCRSLLAILTIASWAKFADPRYTTFEALSLAPTRWFINRYKCIAELFTRMISIDIPYS